MQYLENWDNRVLALFITISIRIQYWLLLLVCVSFTIIGQPWNSVLILILILILTAALQLTSSSSRVRVTNHNWSATKQHLHPQSVAEKPPFSFVRGQDSTMWDIVWVSPQGHRSVSVSRHFLLQAPQLIEWHTRSSVELEWWSHQEFSGAGVVVTPGVQWSWNAAECCSGTVLEASMVFWHF